MEKDFLNSENWKKCGDNKPKAFRLKVHKSDCGVRRSIRKFQSGDEPGFFGLAELENSSDKNYNYGHKWSIKEKPDATTLVVQRGFDRTLKVEHLEQAKVNKLTTADDNLIDIDDDFGFNETSSIFTDSLQFNPATRTDS